MCIKILLSCFGMIFSFIGKMYGRLKVKCYIWKLRRLKDNIVAKLKRPQIVESPEVKLYKWLTKALWPLIVILLWLLSNCIDLLSSLCSLCSWCSWCECPTNDQLTTGSFETREVSYLKLPLMKGTKENKLLNLSLIYLFGSLFSILFFYVQVYFLAKFDWITLVFSLIILVVCTFAPIISQTYGLAMSLLVIPVSATATLRACIFAFILLELQVIAWGNINNNFDNTMDGLSCDTKILSQLWDRHDFSNRDATSDPNMTKANTVHEHSTWYELMNKIMYIQIKVTRGYRNILYVLNGLVQLGKTVHKALKVSINYVFFDGSFEICGINILFPLQVIAWLIRQILILIKTIVVESFKAIVKLVKTVGNELVKLFKDNLSVVYQKNYHFKANSSNKVSFSEILDNAKDQLVEKHWYFALVRQFLDWVLGLYVVIAFFRIFGGAITYLVLFLNLSCYDNMYITENFLKYDKKKQNQGEESLFPLYLFESGVYVRRRDPTLSALELFNLRKNFKGDISMAYYVGTMFVLDYFTYLMCWFVRDWTLKIAKDMMHYSKLTVKANVPFVKELFSNNQQLITDFQSLRDQISNCAPKDVKPEYGMYKKCLLFLFLLFLISIAEPYLDRSRSYLCELLFPHRIQKRSEYLYSFIKYSRIVSKGFANIFCPNKLKGILFQRFGPANLLHNKILTKDAKLSTSFWLKIWPISMIAAILKMGLFKIKARLPQCAKCFKEVDSESSDVLKCPNWKCKSYYCARCKRQVAIKCIICNTHIRTFESEMSEENDSSADELF